MSKIVKYSRKTTDEELQEWDALYKYVKKEILQYDENQNISNQLVLKLKGLKDGKVMANTKTSNNANYTYSTVLMAFKICKPRIMSAIHGKSFKNEFQKFLYICAIVESEINDVYIRLQNAKKLNEKIESIDTTPIHHENAKYTQKTNKLNDNFKNMW